ncbi:MAG: fibronectin type III domain-containing protein [Limisphaerales bacterium]
MFLNFEGKDRRVNRTRRILWKFNGHSRLLAGILFLTLIQNSAWAAQSVTLGWEPSLDPNVKGYKIYYGTVSHNYNNVVAVENSTSATIGGLDSGTTYYFAATTVNAQNEESGFSNEAVYQVPTEVPTNAMVGTVQIQKTADGQFMLTMNGPAKQNLAIEATPDFKVWTVIGTATVGPNGLVNFTDTNAMFFARRFYRAKQLPPDETPFQGSAGPANTMTNVTGRAINVI